MTEFVDYLRTILNYYLNSVSAGTAVTTRLGTPQARALILLSGSGVEIIFQSARCRALASWLAAAAPARLPGSNGVQCAVHSSQQPGSGQRSRGLDLLFFSFSSGRCCPTKFNYRL